MAKRGRPPKNRPIPKDRSINMEIIEEKSAPTPESEKTAFKSAIGHKREGGKDALMREAREMEMKQNPEEEKSEREKIGDKYMEENYGTPEGEQSQESEETPSASEEEQSQESEEAAPEGEPEEEQPKEEMVPKSQWKNAEDKMHEKSTEAANYRKLLDEMSPFMNWEKYQQFIKGEGKVKPEATPTPKVEVPSQDLFVTDYSKWHEQNTNAMAETIINRIKTEFMPQATNQITSQTEWKRLEGEFTREFKDLPNYSERWMPLMDVFIGEERKTNPNATPQQLYDAAKPKFMKEFGITAKKGKKVVPLESPAKGKEQVSAGPSKEMTMDDWEKESREFVDLRRKTIRELQNGRR